MSTRDGVNAALHRGGRFPSATILSDPDVRRLLDDRGIKDDVERSDAIERQYVGVVPQNSLDLRGDRPLAEAICIAHLRLAAAETHDTIAHALNPTSAIELALSRVDEQVARYPWNGEVRLARAMVRRRSGCLDAARDDVVAAVILDPDANEPWSVLEVILRELGHQSEAAIAASISHTLRHS